MSARPIADPIHLFDCVMPCAGAEAFLVCREDDRAVAQSAGRPRALDDRAAQRLSRAIRCRCAAAGRSMPASYGRWPDLTPEDVDFVETYDDYPVIVMMQFEDLGFCAKGEGPDFVRSHTLTTDGTFPHNTSGGQLSVGQAGAAGGFLGLVEAMRQLTAQPLGSQVPRCQDRPRFRLRHDQLRSRPVVLRRHPGENRVTQPLVRPKRKNPLKRTRLPLAPQGVRSRTAHRPDRGGRGGPLRAAGLSRLRRGASIRRATPVRHACRRDCRSATWIAAARCWPKRRCRHRPIPISASARRGGSAPSGWTPAPLSWRTCMATRSRAAACGLSSSSTRAVRRWSWRCRRRTPRTWRTTRICAR